MLRLKNVPIITKAISDRQKVKGNESMDTFYSRKNEINEKAKAVVL